MRKIEFIETTFERNPARVQHCAHRAVREKRRAFESVEQ
jgi:hypothetical protein